MGRYQFPVRAFMPLVALVLLLGGCGYSATSGAASTGTKATPTRTPGSILAWHSVPYPPGTDARSAGIGVSRLGAGAWACGMTPDAHVVIWRAVTPASPWQQMATISPSLPDEAGNCQPSVDANDPRSVAVKITWGSGEAGTRRSMSFLSPDGVTWRQLPGYINLGSTASAGGKRFALFDDTAAPPSQEAPSLVISSDDLHTWHAIRPKDLAANDGFFAFWLDPSRTQLLAASYHNTLWMTTDAGANWTQLSTPAMQTSQAEWLPARAQWQICGGSLQVPFECSVDLGKSWQLPPAFTVTNTCDTCGKGGSPVTLSGACNPDAIQPDGAFVAICGIEGSSSFTDSAAYRLAPGATAWTNFGTAPGNFFAATDSGQLWCVGTQGQIAEATLPA